MRMCLFPFWPVESDLITHSAMVLYFIITLGAEDAGCNGLLKVKQIQCPRNLLE